MQKSQFTIFVPCSDGGEEWIVFNTRTQALLMVDVALKNAIEELPRNDFLQDKQDIVETLLELGIVVENPDDDRRLVNDLLLRIENDANAFSFHVIVLTTLQCNFACAYCFEEGVKQNVVLTPETSRQLIWWIQTQVALQGYEKVYITFYGGEPLLNKQPIYSISQEMKQWCDSQGVDFGFGMITNGYCIDEEDVDKWCLSGMRDVRVTIDGDRASHDLRRPLLNGNGSFDVVIANVLTLLDKKLNVSFSGNYDKENIDAMVRLLDYFDSLRVLHKFKKVEFNPIMPRLGSKEMPHKAELTGCLKSYDEEIVAMNARIRREIKKRGLDVSRGMGFTACSLIARHNGVVIDPEGVIYKCPAMVGYEQFAVGNVAEPQYNETYDMFIEKRVWKKCEPSCEYLPICNGGCRFMAYVKDGSLDNPWCEKAHLDHCRDELIRMDYEALLENVDA